MQFTGQAYRPVKRPSDYELAEVNDGQTESLLLSTYNSSDGPMKPSAQAPQRLSRLQLFPLVIQILLTIFPLLFIGNSPSGRLPNNFIADSKRCCSTRRDCRLSGHEANLSNWTGRATDHFSITHHISHYFCCNNRKILQSLRLIRGRTRNQARGIVLGLALGHSDLSNLY